MPQERSVVGRLPEEVVAQNGVWSESPYSSDGEMPVVQSKTPEVSIDTANQIRTMLEAEYTNGIKNHDYYSYRQLALTVSPAAFRKNHLSGVLNLQFGGDIPLAIKQVLPNLRGKTLLHLDQVRPANPLYKTWREKEEQIESEIFGPTHRPERIYKRPWGGRRARRVRGISRVTEDFYERRSQGKIEYEEVGDLYKVIEHFARRGETVSQFLGNGDVQTLLRLLGRVGDDGKVYYVTSIPKPREEIFRRIFDLTVDFDYLKSGGLSGIKERSSYQRQRASIATFLSSPYATDFDLYINGYSEEDFAKLREDFYSRFPVMPLRQGLSSQFAEIRSGSVDTVIELDRFARVPEEQKEAFIYEMDRILKPGGVILIREDSRHQAEIEYYGQDLFSNGYRRQRLLDLKHPGRWLIVVKQGGFQEIEIDQGPASRKIHSQNGRVNPFDVLKDVQTREMMSAEMGRNIYLTLQEMKSAQNEASGNNELSLAWFRKNGYLSLLMRDFDGDVQKAIEFAQKNFRPDSTKVARPGNGRTFYTVEDMSQELGIDAGIIRGRIKEMGIKGITERSRSGRSAFNKKQVESRRLRFSQEEYSIIVDSLKRQTKT